MNTATLIVDRGIAWTTGRMPDDAPLSVSVLFNSELPSVTGGDLLSTLNLPVPEVEI